MDLKPVEKNNSVASVVVRSGSPCGCVVVQLYSYNTMLPGRDVAKKRAGGKSASLF